MLSQNSPTSIFLNVRENYTLSRTLSVRLSLARDKSLLASVLGD
jgi:hypothetical protein